MPVFEAGTLPDSQKEDLCRTLLAEFGADRINQRGDELIHGCVLPKGNHTDQARNPTASLNWKKLTYKCLGCGSGGGLLWFIATMRRTSSKEARDWLDSSQGLGSNVMALADLLRYFDNLYAQKGNHYEPIPTYSDRVLAPWEWLHPYMYDPPEWVDGKNVGGRGVPEETLLRFRVGYAEQYEWAEKKFSERIVVPAFWQGKLVGWQTRRLWDDGSPKYVSSPAFPREQTLYNYDPSARHAVVVESPFSVLRHAHHSPIVGTWGASITDRQLRLLQKYERITWFLDADDAGWKALLDTISPKGKVEKVGAINALAPYVKQYVVVNRWSADPADMDDATYDTLVSEAVPWPLWSPPTHLDKWEGVSA